MSHENNTILDEAKAIERGLWLSDFGFDEQDVKTDYKGEEYILAPAKYCTDQDGFCEPNEKCECKTQIPLPEELQKNFVAF